MALCDWVLTTRASVRITSSNSKWLLLGLLMAKMHGIDIQSTWTKLWHCVIEFWPPVPLFGITYASSKWLLLGLMMAKMHGIDIQSTWTKLWHCVIEFWPPLPKSGITFANSKWLLLGLLMVKMHVMTFRAPGQSYGTVWLWSPVPAKINLKPLHWQLTCMLLSFWTLGHKPLHNLFLTHATSYKCFKLILDSCNLIQTFL